MYIKKLLFNEYNIHLFDILDYIFIQDNLFMHYRRYIIQKNNYKMINRQYNTTIT